MAGGKQTKRSSSAVADEIELRQPETGPRGKSLVFISHDSRDADLAEAFANLLSDVSGGTLKSFRSSDKKASSGLEFGAEWYKAIMSQLGDATDVVALLPRHSIDRPWILYKAGVAKGKLDTNVLGIALGVPLETVSTGPFGQFQNCGDDSDSLTKLVMQLLARNPDASPREEAVRRQVQAFLEEVGKLLSVAGKTAQKPQTDETATAKLFEEVKAMVRELPERVDERVRFLARRGSPKNVRRLHPMMFEELLFDSRLSEKDEGAAVAWLMFISVFRDDLPWLYEIGLELYRALREGNEKTVRLASRNIHLVVKATSRGPLPYEMLGPEGEEFHYMLRHLPEMIDRFTRRAIEARRRPIREPPAMTVEHVPAEDN
jgi:hypothetical protein